MDSLLQGTPEAQGLNPGILIKIILIIFLQILLHEKC